MPLSDHEQKLLDEIEQALYRDDPKFAATVRSARRRSRTRRIAALCVFGALAGVALLLVGLVLTVIALSVVGFVLLLGSCGYGVQVLRGQRHGGSAVPDGEPEGGAAPSRPSRADKQSSLRNRMEERLRKRFDEN